ncbi:MAG: hypothetical protein V3U17_02635, partial [Thermoplasmata archaeon]
MADLVVQTRLEEEGVLLMTDRVRALLVGLEAGLSLQKATAQAGLSSSAVGRWRAQVRARRGADPLQRSGSQLRASALGAA